MIKQNNFNFKGYRDYVELELAIFKRIIRWQQWIGCRQGLCRR